MLLLKPKTITLIPAWQSKIDNILSSFSEADIKKEPMLFSASVEDAIKLGGPITKHFIKLHLDPNKKWIIDSRVHMLMKGWLPCIGGWHTDDIPRGGPHNQPYGEGMDIKYKSEHILAVVGEVSPTEFILPGQKLNLSFPVGKELVYKDWNKEINKLIEQGKIKTRLLESGEVVKFSEPDFHRGTLADGPGWRFFIRATTNTHRKHEKDPIRRQVQVYLPDMGQGW